MKTKNNLLVSSLLTLILCYAFPSAYAAVPDQTIPVASWSSYTNGTLVPPAAIKNGATQIRAVANPSSGEAVGIIYLNSANQIVGVAHLPGVKVNTKKATGGTLTIKYNGTKNRINTTTSTVKSSPMRTRATKTPG